MLSRNSNKNGSKILIKCISFHLNNVCCGGGQAAVGVDDVRPEFACGMSYTDKPIGVASYVS